MPTKRPHFPPIAPEALENTVDSLRKIPGNDNVTTPWAIRKRIRLSRIVNRKLRLSISSQQSLHAFEAELGENLFANRGAFEVASSIQSSN